MKIVYLNVFENCREEGRLAKVISFVKRASPDFFVISEISEWSENEIEEFKEEIGLEYHYRAEHIAIFSKVKFIEEKHLREAIVMVRVNISGKKLCIIAAHLRPLTEDHRIPQIDTILDEVEMGESFILIGDFNSLSPLDDYDEDRLLREMKGMGLTKFGVDRLRRDVQKKILDFGMVDAVKRFSKDFEYSVPTSFNKDSSHFSKLRLDYAYVTPGLTRLLKSAEIVRTEETDELSDHFPLVVEIDLENS